MPAVASENPTGNLYIDGLLSGEEWTVQNLTFGFPTSASMYGSSYGVGEAAQGFQGLSAAQAGAVRTILTQYSATVRLNFTELTDQSAGNADLRYAASSKPATSWAYTPTAALEGGDVWLGDSSTAYDNPVKGGYAWLTLIHETGHTLGLKHPHEVDVLFPALPLDQDSLEYTVMSYRSYVGASISAFVNGTWDYPTTPMLDDIRALQTLYGARFDKAGTNVTYSWSPPTGEMSINGVGQGAPGANRIFMTVWTGGATATYDFSRYTTGLKVDLQPGHWTITSTAQLAHLDARAADTHLAVGNIANAYLVSSGQANDLIANAIGGSGDDSIIGNDADNKITGGGGNDTISGGAGTNTAVYSGAMSNYAWKVASDGSWTITDQRTNHPDGTDALKDIQFLQFSDRTVAITTAQAAAPAPISVQDAYQNVLHVGADAGAKQLAAQVEAQQLSPSDALDQILQVAKGTTSVATLTYQFFTGAAPSQSQLSYLLAPDGPNPDNLNSAYYQGLSLENRYISFAVKVGEFGDGKDWFTSHYGSLTMAQATATAYQEIFGTAATDDKLQHLLHDPAGMDPTMDRQAYLTAYAGDDLGAKAAMIGWLLGEAAKEDVGRYALANDAFLADLAHGTNVADATVNLIGVYAPGTAPVLV